MKADVRMEGDTFEMEDHRNWTDASFKTYVRPLALPWPYTLPKGETFKQSVTLDAQRQAAEAQGARARAKPIDVKLGGAAGTHAGRSARACRRSEADAPPSATPICVKDARRASLICQIDGRASRHCRQRSTDYRALAEATGADVTLEIVVPGKRRAGRRARRRSRRRSRSPA